MVQKEIGPEVIDPYMNQKGIKTLDHLNLDQKALGQIYFAFGPWEVVPQDIGPRDLGPDKFMRVAKRSILTQNTNQMTNGPNF